MQNPDLNFLKLRPRDYSRPDDRATAARRHRANMSWARPTWGALMSVVMLGLLIR